MSRNDRPRLRYFLAMETTSRRFPPDSFCLAASYSRYTRLTWSTRCLQCFGVFQDQGHHPVQLVPHRVDVFRQQVFFVRRPDRSASPVRTIFCERFSSFFMIGTTLLVRRDSSSSRLTALRRRWVICFISSSSVRFGGPADVRTAPSRRLLASSSRRTVLRFSGSRLLMESLPRVSVVDVFIVRSNGRSPLSTCCRIFDRLRNAIIVFQHPPPEGHPGQLDLLGQANFLVPGQQGDFPHLGQIHPHRIVDPAGRGFGEFFLEVELFLDAFFSLDFHAVGELIVGLFQLFAPGPAVGFVLIDQVDLDFVEMDQQRVELFRAGIDQRVVDLLVGQIPASLPLAIKSSRTRSLGAPLLCSFLPLAHSPQIFNCCLADNFSLTARAAWPGVAISLTRESRSSGIMASYHLSIRYTVKYYSPNPPVPGASPDRRLEIIKQGLKLTVAFFFRQGLT